VLAAPGKVYGGGEFTIIHMHLVSQHMEFLWVGNPGWGGGGGDLGKW